LDPGEWYEYDDVVNPLGDYRECLTGMISIFAYIDTKDEYHRLSPAILRDHPVTSADFENYQPVIRPKIDVARDVPGPYREPEKAAPGRAMRPVSRLLRDFAFQWRHILRHAYNDIIFRRLARAIIRIASMAFHIKKTARDKERRGQALVSHREAPRWESFYSEIIPLQPVRLVVSPDLRHGVRLAQEDFAKKKEDSTDKLSKGKSHRRVYLVSSVRHVLLRRAGDDSNTCTKPESFLDGGNQASDRAIELLLTANHYSNPDLTRIHRLIPLNVKIRHPVTCP
jgi:hypothetical protein